MRRFLCQGASDRKPQTGKGCKPVYDAYRKTKNRGSYRAEHEQALILHEAAAKALKAAKVDGRLQNGTILKIEYEKLQTQKEALSADYGKLKKQVKEYDVIKRNIDSILRQGREPKRSKETTRG